MATLQQIAERAGLSPKTVSRILNGETKNVRRDAAVRARRVMAVARKMNYRPHAAARSMRSRRTYQVGVLLRNAPDRPLHYPPEFEFILGINQFLEPVNYVLSIVRMEDVPVDGRHMSRVFREKMLDGIIVIEGIPDPAVRRVKELIPHCVFLDTNVWEETGCIRRDEVHCGRTVGQAMVNLGYRKLFWAIHELTPNIRPHYSQADRWKGIRQAARAGGMELQSLVLPMWKCAPDSEMLKKRMTPDAAIITNHPHDAVRLAFHGAQLGLCAGKDFGLSTCDESHEVQMAMPTLSRMEYDRMALGRRAGQMLLEMLEENDSSRPSRHIESQWRPGDTALGPGS